MSKTGYYTHPLCMKHEMGEGHPECPERLDAIEDRLLASGVGDLLDRREAPEAHQLGGVRPDDQRAAANARALDLETPQPPAAAVLWCQRGADQVRNRLRAQPLALPVGAIFVPDPLAMPAEGVNFEDKQAVNKALLKSGAAIDEMNCVRKHLSAIKGGRLGAACAPAHARTFPACGSVVTGCGRAPRAAHCRQPAPVEQ